MNSVNLRRASTFHAVAEAGGINAAARALGKSPSAVHYDLAQFQKEFDAALFERVGRRLRLTPEGRLMFETVARALEDIARARARITQGMAAAPELRVAMVSGFGRYRLAPRLFAALPEARPVDVFFGAHEAVVAAVAEGRADFGVTYRAVTATPIRSRKIADEEIVLLGPADTPETARLAPTTAAGVAAATFIAYEEFEYVFARWFASIFQRQPRPLRILDRTSELEEAVEACAAGRGLTIAPLDAWARGAWKNRTRIIRIGRRRCTNALHLIGVGSALEREDAALLALLSQAKGDEGCFSAENA